MVYCGKPSKACAQCREKRTKCDTKWPSCSQCLRAGRTCAGYRDPLSLMFRNQTEELSVKHGYRSESPFQQPKRSPDFIHREPSVSLEVQATCFFFQNYILEDYKGYFSYMPSVYSSLPSGSALSEAINALGTAGIANLKGDRRLMVNANFKYTSALHTINAALQDPYEAKTDQTLVAVMLLGLFEVHERLGKTHARGVKPTTASWKATAPTSSGASTVPSTTNANRVYKIQIFKDAANRRKVINCLQRHIPLPNVFLDWSTDAIQYGSDEEAAVTTLFNISAEYCTFRSEMRCFCDYSRSAEIVSAVHNIDVKLQKWASNLPPQYAYDIIFIPQPSEDVFADHYHLYHSLWIASAWNNYRSMRVLVNELLLVHLIHLSQEKRSIADPQNAFISYDSEVMRVKSVIMTITHDICASVPFYLGYHESQKSRPVLPRPVNGNLLIWPLYAASTMSAASDMMRAWAATTLEKVGVSMGIQQATILASVLKRGRAITLWEREGDLDPEDW